jgi:Protein of unknown function (DUF3761)
MTNQGAPAGWYQQADGEIGYWDGAEWTATAAPVATTWPAPAGSTTAGGRPVSVDRSRAALVAVIVVLGLALIGTLTRHQNQHTVFAGSTGTPAAATASTLAPATSLAAPSVPSKPVEAAPVAVAETTLAPTTTSATTTTTTATAATATNTGAAPTVETTVAPTAAPTFSSAQLAYFEAIDNASKAPQPPQPPATTVPPVANATPAVGCGDASYVNSQGNCIQRPIAASSAPAGATAKCNDGTYSFSQSRSGTCSKHKGVAVWL